MEKEVAADYQLWVLISNGNHLQKSLLFCTKVPFCMSVRFVCVEVLRPSQPSGVMSSAVSLPNHTFTGQA